MDEADRTELVIVPDPTTRLMPFVVVLIGMVWVGMASFIPDIPILVRIAVVVLSIGVLSRTYLTTVRRLVVREDVVDIQLYGKRACIRYPELDYVTVRAQPFGRRLNVVFATRHPRATIKASIPLMANDVRRITPRLIRALTIRGVAVQAE